MNGSASLRLVVQAAMKLDARTPAWKNVVAFIQSCYACRVREYDYDAAMAALTQLSDAEQAALISWVLIVEESRENRKTA